MIIIWASQQQGSSPPPAVGLSIITLGFYPGAIKNIVWFGFG